MIRDILSFLRSSRSLPAIFLLLSACSNIPAPPPEPTPSAVTISINAVGDIMLGTDYPLNHLADDDGISLLEPMSDVLRNADITFGNLEGTLSDTAEPEKTCKVKNHCYLFRSPARYANLLARAGFDVMSLANNHARDFGEAGRSDTMLALEEAGIRHSGREGDIASWQVKGRSVALVAFAPFKNSHDMLDLRYAERLVRQASATHDIVLISMHAGAEGLDAMHLPFEEEFYYGENRGDAVAFAHTVIDAGADLVLGHGPHVPRAMELYQGRLIAYSLGNFCTYYGISVAKTKGLAPVLRTQLDENGQFINGRVISARQIRPGGPVLDKTQQAARLINNLSKEDFPNEPLTLDDAGWLNISKQDEHTVPKSETSD